MDTAKRRIAAALAPRPLTGEELRAAVGFSPGSLITLMSIDHHLRAITAGEVTTYELTESGRRLAA